VSQTVIRVEQLGKKYMLAQQAGGYTTLREKITQQSKSLTRKLLIPKRTTTFKPTREEFWALKDISFEVKQGDRIGIIGRNGAGKSTLLKLLSRITEPTTGRISIKGRVASLLEVGTGFHPELTGRENIYLNGAILGMSKAEIKKKFDEIVAFAEVEKFLDTPVKRYSSGMYVRLAFAVAAHLEPEILVVDEVLAVGDAHFQKKCLGKMQDVSQEQGRAVLFVSHNMDAIQRLCSHCVLLDRGQLIAYGDTASSVIRYLSSNSYKASPNQWVDLSHVRRTGTGEARFVEVQYTSLNEATGFQPYSNGPLEFLLAIVSNSPRSVGSIAVSLYNRSGTRLVNADTVSLGQVITLREGRNQVRLKIEKLYLNPGVYVLGLWLANPIDANSGGTAFDYIEFAFEIEVVNFEFGELGMRPLDDGVVTCNFKLLTINT
jgi:lipopolysaccharide transport system ATP-binding protein